MRVSRNILSLLNLNLKKKKGNPKEYWKMLNSLNYKCKTEVDIKAMYGKMKKKVNEGNCGDNGTNNCEIVLDDRCNYVLNGQITEKEMLKAVRKLKNIKAPGFDKLCKEHIRTSVSCVLSLYVDFFLNLIFDISI